MNRASQVVRVCCVATCAAVTACIGIRASPTEAPKGGQLPPAVIQRIVRSDYAQFRQCYEAGLAKDPDLQGRVVARFVIEEDGRVSSASDDGSDLQDRSVVSCILAVYRGMQFPEPEGNGPVTVVYPVNFAPG